MEKAVGRWSRQWKKRDLQRKLPDKECSISKINLFFRVVTTDFVNFVYGLAAAEKQFVELQWRIWWEGELRMSAALVLTSFLQDIFQLLHMLNIRSDLLQVIDHNLIKCQIRHKILCYSTCAILCVVVIRKAVCSGRMD